MANNLTLNPWYVDTASANYLRSGSATPAPAGLSGTASKGLVFITGINWSGYGASQSCVIKDKNGNTIISWATGTTPPVNIQEIFSPPLPVWDLAVTTLGGGFLTINLK